MKRLVFMCAALLMRVVTADAVTGITVADVAVASNV